MNSELGVAKTGDAGIENLRDVRVVHHCQGLPLGFEPGDDFTGVHAQLDDLEGDLASDGLLLLGHIDDAETALADLLEQPIPADDRAGGFVLVRRFRLEGPHEARGLPVRAQERVDQRPQLGIGTARLRQVRVAFDAFRPFEGVGEDLTDSFVSVRRHRTHGGG